jgi:thiosulfate/3-mercaptopyruvate sulfurtransferase
MPYEIRNRINMTTPLLPLLVEPEQLAETLGHERLLVLHITKPERYAYHIPGALFVQGMQLVRIEKPVMGMLPHTETLSALFTSLGMTPETHVVTCDDEGGGWASRFLWTLDAVGHRHFSLLNGGLASWLNEGHPYEQTPASASAGHYEVGGFTPATVDADYILSRLNAPDLGLLDSRTPQEFSGEKRFAERGGHIPGAVNLNWLDTMDTTRNLRFKPRDQLLEMLESRGLTPDKEIICYCQSHHRSSHAYIMLKMLGYERISGYPGAWSEWGNRSDTPVE